MQTLAVLLLVHIWLNLKFTPKYTIVEGEGGGMSEFTLGSNVILLVIHEPMQNFKIIAFLILGYIWLKLNFTSKYTIVGVKGGGYQNFFKGLNLFFWSFMSPCKISNP